MTRRSFLMLLAIVAIVLACRHEPAEMAAPVPPVDSVASVSVDLDQVPYPTLSQYRFFTGAMAAHQPNGGVLPYDVIAPLFSDYAHKFRFVWMPREPARAT